MRDGERYIKRYRRETDLERNNREGGPYPYDGTLYKDWDYTTLDFSANLSASGIQNKMARTQVGGHTKPETVLR